MLLRNYPLWFFGDNFLGAHTGQLVSLSAWIQPWHVFYLQFTVYIFQIYFLISVNKLIFMMIYKIFIKHTSPIILGGRFLYTLLMS